jgi:hypothetical protein
MIEFLASLDRNVAVGMAQAAAAIALCLGVVVLCGRLAVHVERETVVSLARGLVQMVAAYRRTYFARDDLCCSRHSVTACPRNQERTYPLVLRDCRRVKRRNWRPVRHQDTHF